MERALGRPLYPQIVLLDAAEPGGFVRDWQPPGLPPAIAERMNREVARILATPEFATWLIESQGITPPADTSMAAFRRVHEADIARWATIVKRSGATVD